MTAESCNRVYLAEDSRSVRLLLTDSLIASGFEVRAAEDGEALWSLILEEKPDLIVSDFEMPVLDGLSLCRRIKSSPEFRDIYFIMLTHRSALADRLNGLESGADDYVSKTIPHEELLARIRAGLRIRSLQKELKSNMALLHQREKLASVGQLAAGVAHSINNPIAFVASNLDTFKKYVDRLMECIEAQSAVIRDCADEPTRQRLEAFKKKIRLDYLLGDIGQLLSESRDGIDRVRDIVQGLREFTHVDAIGSIRVDINENLRKTIGVIRHELEGKIVVETIFGDLPEVLCRPGDLNQVFLGILLNAAESIDKAPGRIIVETRAEGEWVEIRISDNGRGIAKKDRPHVFEPFYSGKSDPSAKGLGLSVAWNIVNEHDGQIGFESSEGAGTSFTIRLPVSPDLP